MRHGKNKKRLGRTTSHRKMMIRNMARNLLLHQSIKTTKVKAKETQPFVERLITIAKNDTPFHQRLAFSLLPDKKLIQGLFKEIAPRFKNRAGGYTRVVLLNFRKGDGAQTAILELTEKLVTAKPKVKPKKALPPEKPKEKEKELRPKIEEKVPEQKMVHKPRVEVAEEIAREKAKTEKKKIEGTFLKGLRRFFRRKAI